MTLCNFRKFERQEFHFNDRFNVLIGDNASGKTQVLDAAAIILSSYLLDMEMKAARHINKNDARIFSTKTNEIVNAEPIYPVSISASISFRDKEHKIRRVLKKSTGRTTWLDAQDLKNIGASDLSGLRNQNNEVTFPVLAYYGTGRLWQMKRHTEVSGALPRVQGYRNCLDPLSDHLDFQKWFKKQEQVALQKKVAIPALEAVRKAVKNMIPGCIDFYFDIQSSKIVLEFSNEPYNPFDNLSDGFKNMTAMVADIAYRASSLNPHFGDSVLQSSTGVVIIDEIDLHLHPNWQRSVVDDLKRTFPKISLSPPHTRHLSSNLLTR
jgi:predicted ATP-binding protein involved in virulence